ncbi:MAG TPA: hypothetical protein VGQ86_09055 [Candidatus Limnocylindria bacterium]|nr:hypothetical protein [Candidatus Limnocylindria bacterium]
MPVLLVGAFGGLLAELLKWYQLRQSANLPAYVRSPFYWGVTLVFALVGGVYATFYGIEQRDPVLVTNIGLSAPLLLKSLVSAAGTQAPVMRGSATARAGPSLREFIAGR